MNLLLFKKHFIKTLSIFIFLLIYLKSNKNKNDGIKPNKDTVYSEEKFDSYIEAFNKSRNFLDKNMKGILIEKIHHPTSKNNPKISAVVPCYNCKDYLLRSIRSIQNQNFSDLEIVVVNDNSANDTLSFIQSLQIEDERIKLINNKKNMGTLYTRTIGTLSSKGKYIFPFDSDDMFLDRDVFWKIYRIAEEGDFDIVIFDFITTDLLPDIYSPQLKFQPFKVDRKPYLVLFQPELSYHPIRPSNNNIRNVEILIFARCVKADIYKQALNKLGTERYSRFMHLVEDIINNFMIFNTAKSMKYVPKFGYLYIQRKQSQSHLPLSAVQFLIYRFYLLDILIEYSQDSFSHKKIVVQLIYFCLGNKNLKTALDRDIYNYKLFISCLKRTFSNKYISDNDNGFIKYQ